MYCIIDCFYCFVNRTTPFHYYNQEIVIQFTKTQYFIFR